MKLDIEGSELEVMPDLLLSGALRHVNGIHAEWHEMKTPEDLERMERMQKVYWDCRRD